MLDTLYITTSEDGHDRIYKRELNNYKKANCGADYKTCEGCKLCVSIKTKISELVNKEKDYEIYAKKKFNKKCEMLGKKRRFRILILGS